MVVLSMMISNGSFIYDDTQGSLFMIISNGSFIHDDTQW